ncbi:MAG: hypothetical protein ABI589_03055 [Burkholderiales bacterium]
MPRRFASLTVRSSAIAAAAALCTLSACTAIQSAQNSSSGASAASADQPVYSGYLCCNLRSDGNWASDNNYAEGGKRILPPGTPAKVTGYGRHRVLVEMNGKAQAIGNDYSRDIPLGEFAKRWVKSEDPTQKIASFPPKIREAIRSARVTKGMTRDQVVMAVGWPISSENPTFDAPLWRMWMTSFGEYQIAFDANGRVQSVTTDPLTRNLVVME